MDNVEVVRRFLRAQNLEQVGRTDEAITQYEAAVAASFDASGPYDRLLTIYSNRAQHAEVVRVAESALDHVQTHDAKKAWYDRMRVEALKAQSDVPRPAPRKTE